MLRLESQSMPEVRVNGAVLQWARKLRGLSLEEAALQLNISPNELKRYEDESLRPLVGILRSMSQRYQINFTSLLMPAPLPDVERPTDHRVRGTKQLSMDSLVAIEEVYDALDAFADIAADSERIVPALHIGHATLTDDPDVIAAGERRRFGISIDEQQSWGTARHGRIMWRQRIEQFGVFTYLIPMPLAELSGFSIYRDGLAALCVNDRESEGAKIFTLFHEYYHLMLRQTTISDENNSDAVERLCNQFAASFLIPRHALAREISDVDTPHEFSSGQIKHLSNKFRVSNRAMALRLEKAGFAPRGFYDRVTGAWGLPVEMQTVIKGEPNAIRIRIKRIGKLHANTVIRAAKRHVINSFDAHDLIGLRTPLDRIAAELG